MLARMPAGLQAFVLIFLLGAALRATGVLGKPHADRLAAFVFSMTLPATILVSLDRAVFTASAWKLPLAACLITTTMVVCAWPLTRILQLPRPTQGGFLLATGCINSIYFAYPVIFATLGEAGLARAVLFDLGQTTLSLTGLYALAVWHGTPGRSDHTLIDRLLLSPPIWALGVMLVLKALSLHLPDWLRMFLVPLHLATTPLASLVLGLTISVVAVRRTWKLAALGVVIRMGGGFGLGLGVTALLGMGGLDQVVVLLIAGMPSAVMATIFAAETRLDEDLVATIVALSIGMGVALLPWLPQLAAWLLG